MELLDGRTAEALELGPAAEDGGEIARAVCRGFLLRKGEPAHRAQIGVPAERHLEVGGCPASEFVCLHRSLDAHVVARLPLVGADRPPDKSASRRGQHHDNRGDSYLPPLRHRERISRK